ncbi:single strand binding protein [Caudoviricetes sp.]|nr:single strand binding protein [Caudoviricetes sp.]
MNLAIFSGNLGRDPELRQHNGESILNFALAVQTGTRENPRTMWVDCALWGKRANSLQPYIKKGAKVTVSGQVKLEEYVYNNAPKTKLTLTVDQLDLPPRTKDQAEAQSHQPQLSAPQNQPGNSIDDMNDDIPF